METNRAGYEEAFMNLMSSPQFVNQSFYSFVIAKMQVSINKSVPTAGAGFYNNNFQLVINPDFFNPLPLEQRIGILIHEADHIILKHIFRKGERDHKLFNVAADMALNQTIPRNMLPDGAIYPDSFKDENGNSWPENKTSEQYYEMLKEEKEKQEQEKQDSDGEGQGDGDGEGQGDKGEGEGEGQGGNGFKPKNGNPNLTGDEEITLDDHSLWDEIDENDEELAQEMMTKTLEEAMEKSKGNIPGNFQTMLDLWKRKPKLSWKKILKKYVSSKKGQTVSTIKRRNRRVRKVGVKGIKTHYDIPEVVVGIDTSGSMSNDEIIKGLHEINEVCKLTHSNMKIVQIDTKIQGLEDYDPKMKNFNRKGCGGTYMGAMAEFLNKNKIQHDVLVMISDMFIEDVDTDTNWKAHKKPTLWLNTSGTTVAWEGVKGHVIYDITDA